MTGVRTGRTGAFVVLPTHPSFPGLAAIRATALSEMSVRELRNSDPPNEGSVRVGTAPRSVDSVMCPVPDADWCYEVFAEVVGVLDGALTPGVDAFVVSDVGDAAMAVLDEVLEGEFDSGCRPVSTPGFIETVSSTKVPPI